MLMTVAEAIKAKQIQREEVVALAETLFDGTRTHELGSGAKIVPPAFKDLTPHVREMIVTALLLSKVEG